MMLTNHPRCIFKPDCFIVRLMYTFVCTFQVEPTQSPQVSLVHALNPGVMWQPASHRSGWFGRFRTLTKAVARLETTKVGWTLNKRRRKDITSPGCSTVWPITDALTLNVEDTIDYCSNSHLGYTVIQ